MNRLILRVPDMVMGVLDEIYCVRETIERIVYTSHFYTNQFRYNGSDEMD